MTAAPAGVLVLAMDLPGSLLGYQAACAACVVVLLYLLLWFKQRAAALQESEADAMDAAPIDRIKLPRPVAEYMDAHAASLEELGFDFVDDYLVTSGDTPVFCRYYAVEGSAVFAEISVCTAGRDRFLRDTDRRGLSFVTVFADGAGILTTSMHGEDESASRRASLIVCLRPGLGAADLYTEHRVAVEAHTAVSGAETLRYPVGQTPEAGLYCRRLRRGREASKSRMRLPEPIEV